MHIGNIRLPNYVFEKGTVTVKMHIGHVLY